MKTIRIAVPAGIGDVSWIWSKLVSIPDVRFQIFTPDTQPQRTLYWLPLLGDRVMPALRKHGYNDILFRENMKGYSGYRSWEQILNSHEEGEVIYLQPNQWFLNGNLLRNWMPDLNEDFHYPMFVSEADKQVGLNHLKNIKYPLGIHMASIKGARAWKAWLSEEWCEFLKLVHNDFPEITPVIMGGTWDLDQSSELIGRLPEEVKVLDLVGRTRIGEVITILENLTYYVGYSSGLNVMMNVLGKECTALWPEHQRNHIYCHADPEMVKERKYYGFVYDTPERIYLRCKQSIKQKMEK